MTGFGRQGGLSTEAIDRILGSREKLIRMLVRRTGSRDEAEDILQAAYLRAWERSETVRTEENIAAWFAELVRNLAIDRIRRRAAEHRAVAALARDSPGFVGFSAEIDRSVCECVRDLLRTLKPSYREILDKVELEEWSVKDAAHALGLSPGNARVRLFRARGVLRKKLLEFCGACAEHGCLDCWCKRERRDSAVV